MADAQNYHPLLERRAGSTHESQISRRSHGLMMYVLICGRDQVRKDYLWRKLAEQMPTVSTHGMIRLVMH